jgi:hypothetical protein
MSNPLAAFEAVERGSATAEDRQALHSFGCSPTYRRIQQFVRRVHRQLRRPAQRATRPRESHAAPRRTSRRESRGAGDDDPGGGDPPERLCPGCDKPLSGRAAQARYHDEACRARHRRREALATRAQPPTLTRELAERYDKRGKEIRDLAGLMAQPPPGWLPDREFRVEAVVA